MTQDEFRKEFDKAFWPTLGLHDRQPHAWWLERSRKPTLINEVQDHVGLRLIQPPNLVIVSAATRKSVQPDYILTLESVRVLASLKFASHAP